MEQQILEFYSGEFKRLNIVPKRGGAALQHCAWMIEETLGWVKKIPGGMLDIGKVNRWVGFVQGVLWKEGIYTVDQLREHVLAAKAKHDSYEEPEEDAAAV